ncbi:MAG: S9 family peptidase [Bacteroidales bacterium]|nr:S9 family peptidase [Bacteroidales bacterium]
MKRLLALLIAALILVNLQAQTEKKELTLDLIFKSREFSAARMQGLNPMNDGKLFTQLKTDSINAYSYETGELKEVIVTSSELIPAGDTVPIPLWGYEFSADESKILFATDTDPIYRYSSRSNYFVFDRKIRNLSKLSENGKQGLADFSPDATKVAFVRENNLFIKDLVSGQEKQITFDGKDRHIINGTTDWVYEEEFAITKGFEWSPDGKKIAFMRFDETEVKEWWLTNYGELYPEHHRYKYPKAGENNSIVTVHMYDLESGQTITLDTGTETDQYIPRIRWTQDPESLAIFRVNRLQNKLEILLADASTGKSRVNYTEQNKYYLDENNYDNIVFLENGKEVIIKSEQDGFNHLYLYNLDGSKVNQITSGKWEVTDVLGIDQKNKKVFFQSTEASPLERNIYVVGFDGKGKKLLTPDKGWNSGQFSTDFTYFIKTYSDANTPPVYSVNSGRDGREIRVLAENSRLIEKRREYGLSSKEFFTITTSEGVDLNAWKIMPHHFDPNKKYPVLFTIYGGPGSQTVRNSFASEMWEQYLAQEGIMVVSVDNRGTGFRGEEFKKMTYLQLGKYETIDQIEAAKYLASLPYVDADKIGVFGWSYGGYMSTLCITKGADIFDVAIAVAPVTNWRFYDNIYTERFMRTPQENPDGYDDNSPINHVEKLKGKYLLIHGMSDDNVHPENTYDLITALVAADKDFELMVYPNSNHGIYTGQNTRFHLYRKMTDFLLFNLKGLPF